MSIPIRLLPLLKQFDEGHIMRHLATGFALRADHTIGTHSLSWDSIVITSDASAAILFLDQSAQSWRSALSSATDADLDKVGRSAFPWGLDTRLPFLDIVWWVNQKLLHHGAEIALLRDLYHFRTS